MKEIQKAYRLKKRLPHLCKGVIFVLNTEQLPWGAYLAWRKGDCQGSNRRWCGGAFRLPAQALDAAEWFEEITNDGTYYYNLRKITKTFEIIVE